MDPCQYAEFLEPVFDDMERPARPCENLPWLQLELLERIANSDRLAEIRDDRERLDWIEDRLRRLGIREPLTVVVDDRGQVILKDGHHRLLVSRAVGLRAWPVQLRRSERIRARGTPVADFLEAVLMP